MKKIMFILILLSFFLLFSCGLDVYYIIEPPMNTTGLNATPENPSQDNAYLFSFTTADSKNTNPSLVGEVKLLGTDVYYRIYNNLLALQSDMNSISTANTEYTENGFNKLVSLEFMKLSSSNISDPLIKKSKDNKDENVEIRLFEIIPYKSEINVDNNIIGEPLRYNGDAFQLPNYDEEMTGLDVDISSDSNSLTETPVYYVLMYAVSVGSINLSQRVYSSLAPLGYIQLQ